MRRAAIGAVLTIAVWAGLSCGGDHTAPQPPDPGPVAVIVTTPNADDGALLITVTGGAVTSVETAGYEFSASVAGTTTRLMVRGAIISGSLVQLTIPDRHQLSAYRVTVDQAAARGPSYQQRATSGYRAKLRAP